MRAFNFGLVSLIFGVLISCSKSQTDDRTDFDSEKSWTIGSDHSMDTLLTVPASESGSAELAIEAYSICPTHQVELIVSDDTGLVLFEKISDTLMVETFPIHTSKPVKIQSKLIEHKQDVACVWLGQARLVYRYVE